MTTVQTNTVSPDLLAAVNGTRKTAASTAEEAQDRFMTLLVTQMRNQDPLNPLDNAQVTSQLAQLSTVTGIDKLNATLQALQGSYQTSQSLQAANMIGHGVLVPGSSVSLADSKAVLGVEVTEPADNVRVTIRNAAGLAVHTVDLGGKEAGMVPLTWDGQTDSGGTAPDGAYSFDVTATRGGKAIPATALSFGVVGSVTTGTQGVSLNVPGLGAVNLSDIRQIL
ncbi:flagellar hook assembly protein FlgD [Herbaspirillum sp. ST 5-3]|uniref:flagellar hook assembly protein FlgD n=1 Tax=Oxalobacteraceae TaxID=75682 RepID=UPI0010A58CF7|nr:flagellar hook assembly protein FlgD [Herbaspirillum sp. ST 5-3]